MSEAVWPPPGTIIRLPSDVPLTRAFDVVRFYVKRLAVEKPQKYEVLVGDRDGDVRLSDACALVLDHIDRLTRERDEMEQAAEALEAKCRSLSPSGETCACSWDRPDDICMCHSPRLKAATARLAEFETLAREAAMTCQIAGPGTDAQAVSIVARLVALAGPEGETKPPATLGTLGRDIVAWEGV